MQIKKLTIQDTECLLQAINQAFADYIIPFKLTAEQLHFKITSENIQLDWSVGVFVDKTLIAFIMHGVYTYNGETCVYNAGTGVLPAFRGQGLVGKMYDFISPFLRENQTRKLVLEVIEGNHSAIRSYEKFGFSIQRKLLCFEGKLHVEKPEKNVVIKTLDDFSWSVLQSFWDIEPSWQSAPQAMNFIKPSLLGAFVEQELVGYVFFNPLLKRIYQIAVSPGYRRKGIGTQLLAETSFYTDGEKIQVNNVDESAEHIQLFLEKYGLINDISQFEMIKHL